MSNKCEKHGLMINLEVWGVIKRLLIPLVGRARYMTNLFDKYFLRIYQLLKATAVNIPEQSKKMNVAEGRWVLTLLSFFSSILSFNTWRKHMIASLFYGRGNWGPEEIPVIMYLAISYASSVARVAVGFCFVGFFFF